MVTEIKLSSLIDSVELEENERFSSADHDDTDSLLENCLSLSQSGSLSRSSKDVSESLSLTVLDDREEVQYLKRKVKAMEDHCKKLEEDNDKLSKELFQEKLKIGKMRTKLQFVKENQDVFLRLKEAYINMKYNESTGKKMVEIKENSMQTYDGILCSACIKTEQVRRSLEKVMYKYENAVIISQGEMDKLNATVSCLREMIDRREKQWGLNLKREVDFKQRIENLVKENGSLKSSLKDNIKSVSNKSCSTTSLSIVSRRELYVLKKLIIKLEKRHRYFIKRHRVGDAQSKSCLTERESKFVRQLFEKYNKSRKLNKTKSGNYVGPDTENIDVTLKDSTINLDSDYDKTI